MSIDSGPVLVDVEDVRVVAPGDWDDLVASLGSADTYLRAAYHEASARLEPAGTRPVYLHVRCPDGDVALPLLLRPLPDGTGLDATTPYGYGGPVTRTSRGGAALGAALDRWAKANGVVCTFLRLHPLLGNARLLPASADVVELGATVAWDVSPGRDLAGGMHPHHRRAVRRALAAGLQVTVTPDPASLEGFRKLYEVTMRRQDAAPFFFFPDAYWDTVLEHRAELEPVLVEGRLEGEVVASLLCFVGAPWLHYHLGGSADIARRIGATNACFVEAAQWAQARGLTCFHLGGGVGGSSESSLYAFKGRFDPDGARPAFRVAKLVHDAERYEALAGTSFTSGFFPAWRAG